MQIWQNCIGSNQFRTRNLLAARLVADSKKSAKIDPFGEIVSSSMMGIE